MKRILATAILTTLLSCNNQETRHADAVNEEPWRGWSKYQIKPEDSLTRYGHELVANTSYYLGPKGKIAKISNGMNCQNCHLDAGTFPFGNNYRAVVSTYPKFRARSGRLETIP